MYSRFDKIITKWIYKRFLRKESQPIFLNRTMTCNHSGNIYTASWRD